VPRRVEPTEWARQTKRTFERTSDWVASNVRALRAARGLTQLQLAERAGVSLQYVTQMESAVARPNLTLRALAAVAAALSCEPYELLSPAAPPAPRSAGRPAGTTG
jgi:transcriptional regulator with XRE-family HTH domain